MIRSHKNNGVRARAAGWIGFVLATAFFWGAGEALANRFWPPKLVWQPDLIIVSIFDRVVFYGAFVAAAVLVINLGRGLIRLIRKRPFPEGRRRWAGAAAAAAVIAVNAGWLVAGVAHTTDIKAGVSFDLNKLSGFIWYWVPFVAAAVLLTCVFAFAFGKRRWAEKAGRILRAVGAVGFVAALAIYGGYYWLRPVPRGPNLVLIVLDAWRGDCFRPDLMPKLSAFADANALVFDRSWTCGTWTYPAMSAVFTGQYPDTCQTRRSAQADRFSPSFAQGLRNRGYDTAAFIANRILDRDSPICDGFEEFHFTDNNPWLYAIRFYGTNWYGPAVRGAIHKDADSEDSRKLVRALAAYGRRPHRRPYCAWVHFLDPHAPYVPPPGYYLPADEKYVTDFNQLDTRRRYANKRLYEGECRFMDDILTPILPALTGDGRTILVIIGDHGEEFWEHGNHTYGHGKSVYETLMRVPLIMVIPGAAPARIAMPVNNVDLAPTLMTVMGQTPFATMEGKTFLDSGGKVLARPEPLIVGSGFFKAKGKTAERRDAIIGWPRKFIIYRRHPGDPGEYYDLENDPDERYMLPEDAQARALRARLLTWMEGTGSKRELAPYGGANPADLKALGYVK